MCSVASLICNTLRVLSNHKVDYTPATASTQTPHWQFVNTEKNKQTWTQSGLTGTREDRRQLPSPQSHHHNPITTIPSPQSHLRNPITTVPSPQSHHHNSQGSPSTLFGTILPNHSLTTQHATTFKRHPASTCIQPGTSRICSDEFLRVPFSF